MTDTIRTQRGCLICDCIHAEKLLNYSVATERFYDKLPRNFNIVACNNCGLIYYDILSTQTIYDDYYKYYSVYENLGQSYGHFTKNIINLYQKRADEIVDFICQDSTILDIGCANGNFLDTLKKMGFKNLCGLDVAPKCVELVQQKGFEAYEGGVFEEIPTLYNRFDCITLTQVLEHIYDVNGAIENIKRMLKPKGLLYIEVPDASRYHLFAKHAFSHFQYEHIFHFDPVSLENLAVRHGFQVKSIVQRDAIFNTDEPTMPYVSVILQCTERNHLKMGDAKDKVKLFIELSRNNTGKLISELSSSEKPLAIWGIGTSAMQLLNQDLSKCNIQYLIDSNPLKQGMTLQQYTIKAPSVLVEEGFKGRIFISSALYQNEIIDQIRSMGLKNECFF